MTQHLTVTAEPPVDVQTPTVTHYQKLAGEFIAALDQIASVIPQFEESDLANAKFVRAHLNVPDQFCSTAIVAVEQVPGLNAVGKLDPVAGRDALQFIEAFRPVLDKAVAFGKNLKYTVNQRKAVLARSSLQIYSLVKGLARDERSPEVEAHVENLKRDLDRRRPTKAEREQRKAAKAAALVAAAKKEVTTA